MDIHKEFIKKNKVILKTQERFRSKKRKVFTEEVNKELSRKKEESKCNNIIRQCKNVQLRLYYRRKHKGA